MTAGEKLHAQREQEIAQRLEVRGLILYRCDGRYDVEDRDGFIVLNGVTLLQIARWLGSW